MKNYIGKKIVAFSFQRLLSNAEDECTHLKSVNERSTKELGDLIEQHRQV